MRRTQKLLLPEYFVQTIFIMGKQIGFYMLEQNENAFFDFVLESKEVIPLIDVQSTNISEYFAVLDKNQCRENSFSWKIMFWNSRVSPPVKIRFIKNGLYSIDETESEVVEFFRCGKVDGRVSEGRIYIQTSFFDDHSNLVKKSDQFIKWYESLARWIKKHAVSTNETWRGKMYVMKAAHEFFEKSRE